MRLDYNEDERIELLNGLSHCRCRNKATRMGENSCMRFKQTNDIKYRKRGLPEDQQCYHNTDAGYCKLSRINEISLIKQTEPDKIYQIIDRIVTEKGLKLLGALYRKTA